MLKAIELSQSVKDTLRIDPGPITRKKPGKADADYVSGACVADILNKAFNYAWDWKIERCWIEQSTPYTDKYKRDTDGKPLVEPQPPVAYVLGTLTVHMLSDDGKEITISKSATGSKEMTGRVMQQENVYQTADTNAMKRAARLLGVCLKLWRKNADGIDDNQFFNSLIADELWTPEVKEAHKADFEFLEKVQKERGFSAAIMDQAVQAWSSGYISGLSALKPDQLTQFVEYIRSSIQGGGAA